MSCLLSIGFSPPPTITWQAALSTIAPYASFTVAAIIAIYTLRSTMKHQAELKRLDIETSNTSQVFSRQKSVYDELNQQLVALITVDHGSSAVGKSVTITQKIDFLLRVLGHEIKNGEKELFAFVGCITPEDFYRKRAAIVEITIAAIRRINSSVKNERNV